MKRSLTLIILLLFALLTNAQGVYDDFIYTRERDSVIIHNALIKFPESVTGKITPVITKIDKLLHEGNFKQIENFLKGQKITLNDIEYFNQQTDEYKSLLVESHLIDCQNLSSDLNDRSKLMLFFTYSNQQPGKSLFVFRIYFVIHLENEKIKNVDITFVKVPTKISNLK